MTVAVPTSSSTISIGELLRQPYVLLTQAELDKLDMVSNNKQGE